MLRHPFRHSQIWVGRAGLKGDVTRDAVGARFFDSASLLSEHL